MGFVGDAEGWDVAAGSAKPTHQRKPSYPHVLMDHAVAGNKRAVGYLRPSGNQRATCDNRVVTDPAVMTNMGVLHEEVAVTDNRRLSAWACPVHRDALAKNVMGADTHASLFAPIGYILGLVADNHVRMKHVVFANLGGAEDCNVVQELRMGTEAHSARKHAKRTYLHPRPQFHFRAYYGCRMYYWLEFLHRCASRSWRKCDVIGQRRLPGTLLDALEPDGLTFNCANLYLCYCLTARFGPTSLYYLSDFLPCYLRFEFRPARNNLLMPTDRRRPVGIAPNKKGEKGWLAKARR